MTSRTVPHSPASGGDIPKDGGSLNELNESLPRARVLEDTAVAATESARNAAASFIGVALVGLANRQIERVIDLY